MQRLAGRSTKPPIIIAGDVGAPGPWSGELMSRLVIVLAAIELVILLAIGWLLGPALEQQLVPGLWIWDASVGGQTPTEAATQLRADLPLYQPIIVLVGPEGQTWSLTPVDLGMGVDMDETLARAFEPGHGVPPEQAVGERLRIMLGGRRLSPVLTYDPDTALRAVATVGEQLDRPARDAAVQLVGTEVVLAPGNTGRRMEVTRTLAAVLPSLLQLSPVEVVVPVTDLMPALEDGQAEQAMRIAEKILEAPLTLLVPDPREGDPGPWDIAPDVLAQMLVIEIQADQTAVTLDQAAMAEQLGSLATALYRDPVDATYDFNMATIQLDLLTPSATGREVDVAATVSAINQALSEGRHMVPLVLRELLPAIDDTLTAEDLGVRELVAVGESYFTGSSSVFSFNEHLGDVTPEAGYDESYVIIGNRTVPGVGGGICQVATTAFRAAYFGGFPIIERWPHAYRVGYYELGGFGPGFDATIYSPVVDFRFNNDTPYHILVRTEVDPASARLRFLFYSTSANRNVEQIGPEWGDPVSPGPPVYEYDATLPSGTVRKLESAHDGLSARLGRVVTDEAGNVLSRDEFVSNFIPWSARYAFGPGYTPPAGVEVVGLPEP